MATERMNNQIVEHSVAKTDIILPWKFIPTGNLYVNDQDTDSFYGELYYENPNFEIGGAVRVRDWVFVSERMRPEVRQRLAPQNDPNAYMIAGFYHNSHFSFVPFISPVPDIRACNQIMINFVVTKLWPIFHIECFDRYLSIAKNSTNNRDKEDIKMMWNCIPFPRGTEGSIGIMEGGVRMILNPS